MHGNHSENILIIDFSKDHRILELTPLIHHMASASSGFTVNVCVRKTARAFLDANPYLKSVYTIPDSFWKIWLWFRHLKIIRSQPYDYLFFADTSLTAQFLGIFIPAKLKFRLVPEFLSRLPLSGIRIRPQTIPCMNKLRLLDFLEILPRQLTPPEFFVNPAEKERVDSWLVENNLLAGGPFICIAPGAEAATLSWLPERFAKLADNLVNLGYPVIIVGKSSSYERGLQVESLMKETSINTIGQFSVRQTGYLISYSKMLISNDNFTTSLAACNKIPNIIILGGSVRKLEYRFLKGQAKFVENTQINCRPCSSYGRNYCPLGHFSCMRDITVNQVFQPILELLKSNKI